MTENLTRLGLRYRLWRLDQAEKMTASSVAWLAIDLTALGIVVYALIRRKGGDE